MRVSLENITYGELVRYVYQPCIMTLSSSWIGVSKSCWDCLGILARRDQELICKESRVDILRAGPNIFEARDEVTK